MTSSSDILPWSQKLFFGFGHVLNDMCASMWFNYLLVYYHSVLSLTNLISGTILLVGQVADALTTPVIGIESDRAALCSKYGKRKSWHLLGFIMVIISFVFIFNPCFVCNEKTSGWAQFAYFAPVVVVFQIGWAATQISHLSLIPVLTPSEHERVGLTSIRYGFTVASNFVVFGSVTGLLTLLDGDHDSSSLPIIGNHSIEPTPVPIETQQLSPRDIPVFRYLVIIVLVIGSLFTIGFHIGVKEPGPEPEPEPEAGGDGVDVNSEGEADPRNEVDASMHPVSSVPTKMGALHWLKEPHFYLVGFIYICVRLITNVSQVYMSLLINDTLRLRKLNLALVPLTIYAMSMLTSFGQKKLNKFLGRTITLGAGMVICISFSVMIYFTDHEDSLWQIYVAAVIIGLGTSILMIGSLSLTADLIGSQCSTAAFVYGVMSFGDKLSNGIAIEVIQAYSQHSNNSTENALIYKNVETWGVGGISLLGLILTCVLATRTIDNLRFYKRLASSKDHCGFGQEVSISTWM